MKNTGALLRISLRGKFSDVGLGMYGAYRSAMWGGIPARSLGLGRMAHIVELYNEEYRRALENSTLLTGCVNYTDRREERILKKGAGEAFSEKFFPALATKYSKTLDKSRGIWYTIVVRGYSSVGRALEWHSRGQGFDSPYLHGFRTPILRRLVSFFFAVERTRGDKQPLHVIKYTTGFSNHR